MAKAVREKIRLNSSAGTGHFYTTTKNKRTMTGKFEIKKYDPCLLYTSPSPRDDTGSRMPSSA